MKHITGDKNIENLCREIYTKYKDVLDIIFENCKASRIAACGIIDDWCQRKCKNNELIYDPQFSNNTYTRFTTQTIRKLLPPLAEPVSGWKSNDIAFYEIVKRENYFKIMYIRIASNDFFSVSKDVVSKMIAGEYNAAQAYRSFNAQLLAEGSTAENVVLDSQKSYSNRFHSSGGNAAYSVMANTLRGLYGTDVLLATGNSFTGNVLKAGYTEKMAGDMIMPNGLSAYSSKMSGAELKETVKNFVEGYEGGFVPFNRGSLPVVSGISVEIKETEDGYSLSSVTKNGKQIRDEDTFTVTCLALPKHMEAYPADGNIAFDGGDTTVKNTWTGYI